MQTIGERLEEARKKKGISIREAAEATKIRGDYLQKFEGNQFDIGLSDIYVRGFLRNYAAFLKMPSDRILNDYTALGRGESRSSRPPVREGYGRTGIAPAPSEPGESAPPPVEASADPGPGRVPPRRSISPPALPTGPDPAVIFRWVKFGAAVIGFIILVWLIKSLFWSSSSPAPTPAGKAPAAARAPVLGFYATNTVKVTVKKKLPNEAEGEVLLATTLAAGESKVIPRTGAVYVEASRAEFVDIEIDGKRANLGTILGNGYQRGQLPAPK
ncbi:MAG: helix-turn-helix domain-containing protein [Opitutaceae bacterium]